MNKNLELFLIFMKVGAITFGGGYAMIANVSEEVVEKRHWLTNEEFLDMVAVGESTPGPIVVNLATYIGYRQNKILGSLLATLGVILPSFLIILLVTLFLDFFKNNIYVNYFLDGLKCGACFLILKSFFTLLKGSKWKWYQIVLMLIAAITMIIFSILGTSFSAIFLILFGGLCALIINLILNARRDRK